MAYALTAACTSSLTIAMRLQVRGALPPATEWHEAASRDHAGREQVLQEVEQHLQGRHAKCG